MGNKKETDTLLRSPAGDIISPVENFDDIIINFRNFQEISNSVNCLTYDRFSMFYHWYFLPIDGGIYAPSKFIGYKGTTVENYQPHHGTGKHGGETEDILERYFPIVIQSGEQFNYHYEQLERFARALDKKICKKVTSGKGAIHLPNEEFIAYIRQHRQTPQITSSAAFRHNQKPVRL
jgi:hypothetical protein